MAQTCKIIYEVNICFNRYFGLLLTGLIFERKTPTYISESQLFIIMIITFGLIFVLLFVDILAIHYAALIKDYKRHIYKQRLKHYLKLGMNYCLKRDFTNANRNSRLIRLLNLTSLKHIIKNIAYRHGLTVTFIQAHYTSKACSQCGYVSDENRKTQESFLCVECGYENNADRNAAINIQNRVVEDVLRSKLLKYNKFQELVPLKMKKEDLKELLETHNYSGTEMYLKT